MRSQLCLSIVGLRYFLEQGRVCINKQVLAIQGYLLTFTTDEKLHMTRIYWQLIIRPRDNLLTFLDVSTASQMSPELILDHRSRLDSIGNRQENNDAEFQPSWRVRRAQEEFIGKVPNRQRRRSMRLDKNLGVGDKQKRGRPRQRPLSLVLSPGKVVQMRMYHTSKRNEGVFDTVLQNAHNTDVVIV